MKTILPTTLAVAGISFAAGFLTSKTNQKEKIKNMNAFVERARNVTIVTEVIPSTAVDPDELRLSGTVTNHGENPTTFAGNGFFPDCTIYIRKNRIDLVAYTALGEGTVSPFRDSQVAGSFPVAGNSSEDFTIDLSSLFQLADPGQYILYCQFKGYGMPSTVCHFEIVQEF